ncbi:SDR family NAD(P)-dependent oxidoreductase [Streptomyces sp. NPDC001404]|uniref:SDR family NAD(P)-dependent oxidoreductase n=1 Tax=Streptomyces sp. NPDC001404 TaxID=3364571 RepID=UPI0036A11CAD
MSRTTTPAARRTKSGRRAQRHGDGAFLTGRTCLVVGGAQGIGWATAVAMADHGAVVHVCDVDNDSLARATEETARLPWPERLLLARCDATDRRALEQWITEAHIATGRIDVLVNNAAFTRWEPVETMSTEEIEQTMAAGYGAMVSATKTVLPLMRTAGGGHIVTMGSSLGRLYVKGPSAAYCASKAALEAFTTILQIELQNSPVHATLIRPGAVAGTGFFQHHVSSQRMPRLADFLPCATPPDIAHAVLKALRRPRATVDIPRFLPALYLSHALFPGTLRRLMETGGPGRRDYGNVRWTHHLRRS